MVKHSNYAMERPGTQPSYTKNHIWDTKFGKHSITHNKVGEWWKWDVSRESNVEFSASTNRLGVGHTMAHVSQLPCDGDGVCMVCKNRPPEEENLTCGTCTTPWHVSCLAVRPETLASTLQWECPDCTTLFAGGEGVVGSSVAGGDGGSGDLIAAVRAIEADESLTERGKAKKRQRLLSGKAEEREKSEKRKGKEKVERGNDVLDLLDESFKCSFCMQLPERPVTTPCGHNFCLKCFQKWVGQGKRTCAKCRCSIPPKMASQPRINSALVVAIRLAKTSKTVATGGPEKIYHVVHNQNLPDKAYTTERAKRAGNANAASGRIFVTAPADHLGPILAEHDPVRRKGVLVGEFWQDRYECRQWGAHRSHVAGINGQSKYGAQSVVLSGGYEDDEDHGEWFLYTGSGGRDLSGNKRTNKEQSFDQMFKSGNEALRVSCIKGYPVRVIRSYKEKRSSYAPEGKVVRYDGIYRIEKCWRKVGKQGFKVCRYLFVRCDNEPAPWTSDEHGDRPRPFPVIPELKQATDLTERKESPSWDYDEEEVSWKWKKPPPRSRQRVNTVDPEDVKIMRKAIRKAENLSVKEKLLKEFNCFLCQKVMTLPLTTPCAHNFCKSCLEGAFAGQTFVRERKNLGGRTLRAQKNIMACPSCKNDISEFLKNPQVNTELMGVIEKLQGRTEEDEDAMDESSEDENEDGDLEDSDIVKSSDATTEIGENNNMPNPLVESSTRRVCKRKKVDASPPIDNKKSERTEKQQITDVGEENGISGEVKFDVGNDSQVSVPAKGRNDGARSGRLRGRPKAKNTSAQESVDEGNDSPSSPLHVQSDDGSH